MNRSSLNPIVAWLALVLAALSLLAVAPARADECTVPPALTKTRPHPDGPPTRVDMGIVVIDVIGLSDTTQLFIAAAIRSLVY